MSSTSDLFLRALVALAAVSILFTLRWHLSLQHFDWQVWEAAVNMVANDANPYDARALNDELQANPEVYGDIFDDENFFMFLANPPTWLTLVKGLGTSALAVALVGALCLYGSIVALMFDRPMFDFLMAILATTMFSMLSPAATSFLYGQPGFFIAGMVGLQLLALGSPLTGVPAALLAGKPHIAFGAGIVDLVRDPKSVLTRVTLPYGLLVLATTALFGPRIWEWFFSGLISGNQSPQTSLPDMSLGTLSSAIPWRSLGLGGVMAALAASAAVSWWCRKKDPAAALFASLALVVYLSGHAFFHDWMWLPLVPIALRWNPLATGVSIVGVGMAMTVSQDLPYGAQSLVGLVVTAGLVACALLAKDVADPASNPADQDVDGVDEAEARLAA